MKNYLITIASALSLMGTAQKKDTLFIYYYENYPLAFTEKKQVKGVEPDIAREYITWLSQKKSTEVIPVYKGFTDFAAFYAAVRNGAPNVIGMGSVARSAAREKEIAFSPPYLRNVSVLITAGSVPTIRTKEKSEIATLCTMSAMTVANSSHQRYLEALKSQYCSGLKITSATDQNALLDAVSNSANIFGYVDIVAYWAYVKRNPGKFTKMQKIFNASDDGLAFIMPLKGQNVPLVFEFFESGFGFTATKTYSQILEKYLGYEIIESVEVR